MSRYNFVERNALVSEMLQLLGLAEMMQSSLEGMKNSFIEKNPDAKQDLEFLFSFVNAQELVDELMPVYRHYSDEDLTELIQFYKSPVGQKLIALQPTILVEVSQISQNYLQKLEEKVKAADEAKRQELRAATPASAVADGYSRAEALESIRRYAQLLSDNTNQRR